TKASKGPCATITPPDKPLGKVAFRRAQRKNLSGREAVTQTFLSAVSQNFHSAGRRRFERRRNLHAQPTESRRYGRQECLRYSSLVKRLPDQLPRERQH